MKKILSVFAIAALFVAAAVSCSKEINDPEDNENTQEEEVVAPEEPEQPVEEDDTPVPEGMIRLRFAVSHEGDAEAEDDEAKTSWDGNTHSWSDGDQIRILWGEGASDYVDATVSGGSVSAVVADADYYYAVYPTTATYSFDATEGKITVSFIREQSGAFADANIMAANTSKAAASFSFKNMTSILKFSTGSSCSYTKVTFCANDKTKLNGDVSTTFDDSYTNASTGANRDLLTVNVTAGNTYYLAVLPDITLSNGIGFKVEASNQDTGALSTRSLTMSRTGVLDLGTIDNMIRKDWFIKEGGTGKGTSWEDAGGAERLVQLIYPDQSRGDGAGLTAAYRLHKATIHVAAGTYNIQAANGDEVLAPSYNTSTLTATIKGGYPTGLTGTSTSGRNSNNFKTCFICNQASDSDRILSFTDTFNGSITFNGIYFPANGSSRVAGTACFVNSSNFKGTLKFENCSFTDFVQSGTVNGGPVYIQDTNESSTVSFSGCTFSGNKCNTGGAVYINQSVKGMVKFINNCSFSANSCSTGAAGGSIRARAGNLLIDSCSFTGLGIDSGDTATAGNGGAIWADGASCDIRNSSFSDFKVKTSGAAIGLKASSNSAFIGNCVFNTNKAGGVANTSGGVVYSESGSKILLANSTISDCASGGDSSAMFIINGTGTFYIVSCTLASCQNQIISRGVTYFHIYNSILLGGTTLAGGTQGNIKKYYSIYGENIYTTENSGSALGDFELASFNSGVFPLNNVYSAKYEGGMTVNQLQEETYNITLTQDQLDLLAKDQKGNDRNGTIMGAYVLTQ